MKFQMIVKTPLETITGDAGEYTEDEYSQMLSGLTDNIENLTHITLTNQDSGSKVIIPAGIIQNSIITINRVS